MSTPTSRQNAESLRVTLQEKQAYLIDKLYQQQQAADALFAASRKFAAGSTERTQAEAAKTAADSALVGAQATVKSVRGGLVQAIVDWLADTTTGEAVSAEEDLARLESSTPIVMLPVRLETRFVGKQLKLRVFPDEISVNTHETALTDEEYSAGKKYYDDFNTLGNEEERWREIVARYSPERSAYILRVMLPSFGAPYTSSSASSSTVSVCGTSLAGGRDEALYYPTDIQRRAGSWTRPAEATLPDRWVVATYRNGVRKVYLGKPIVEPLAVTFDPGLPSSDRVNVSNNDYKIDENTHWMVDFDKAVDVGMALTIDLSDDEAKPGTGGFERVIVLGVKSSMGATTTSEWLEKLLDAHHYTRGLAIVRQGTPTNNTKGNPTPFPPADNAGERSFEIERRRAPINRTFAYHCMAPDTDGYFLMRMFGVPSGVACNIDRAFEHEVVHALDMNTAMWPGSYGYYLQYMIGQPYLSEADIATAKRYFSSYVTARGPAPAFRIGAVPYGMLPVTSLHNWKTRQLGTAGERLVEEAILKPLQYLIENWLDASWQVHRIRPGSKSPNADLVSVLSTYPSAKEVRVRAAKGEITNYNIWSLEGWNYRHAKGTLDRRTRALFRRIGLENWNPRIGHLTFEKANLSTQPLVRGAITEEKPLAIDIIQTILSTLPKDLLQYNYAHPGGNDLLHWLLRNAALREYARIGQSLMSSFTWSEQEIWGVGSQPKPMTMLDLFQSVGPAAYNQATEQRTAMSHLVGLPSAEIERLTSESLDLSSHRVDAWATAFATRRVSCLRAAQERAHLAPKGNFLGGYGWLEDLRPVARTIENRAGVGDVEIEGAAKGGYIHAPSSSHAATAAILRNARLNYADNTAGKYAVDLSSRRVRLAKQLLDEMRNGLTMGAILGYRFERALHEGYPGVANMDDYRLELRSLFPLVAGKDGVDTSEPAEKIAARNVVDGLQLLRHKNSIDFSGNPNLPKSGSDAYAAIQAEIAKLGELCDAVADLLMAETVFQLARGNVVGAPPSMENPVAGRRAADPVVADTARAGTGVSHRVAFVFSDGTPTTLPTGWPAATPRAKAEPVLDAWLGRLLGDPSKVTCKITFDEAPGSVTVTLADLGMRPLDVLALARVVAQEKQGALLDELVLSAGLGLDTSKSNVAIVYAAASGRDPRVERTFPEVLEIARALAQVLGATRPIEVADLLPPAEKDAGLVEAEADASANADELLGRAVGTGGATEALQQVTNGTNASQGPSLLLALGASDPTALREALVQAARFAPERAFPPRAASLDTLVDLATAVQTELNRRLQAVPAEPADPSSETAKEKVARATESLRVVFGGDFFAMPKVSPPRTSELQLALDNPGSLLDATDPDAPGRFLDQLMHSHAPLATWRRFQLYARALGTGRARLEVVQLPFKPGEKWLGLRRSPGDEPVEARSSLLLLSETSGLDATEDWRGIVLDQWTEVIPRGQEQTAMAFHYDSPRSAAPQAVLVVAPASDATTWQFDDVLRSLEETLALAKVRTVDCEILSSVGQLVPTTLLPVNPDTDITISTDFAGAIASAIVDAFKGFTS